MCRAIMLLIFSFLVYATAIVAQNTTVSHGEESEKSTTENLNFTTVNHNVTTVNQNVTTVNHSATTVYHNVTTVHQNVTSNPNATENPHTTGMYNVTATYAVTNNVTVAVNVTTVPPPAEPKEIWQKDTFIYGSNGWNFEGFWGRYNLSSLALEKRPVPLPDSNNSDSCVLICMMMDLPSFFSKTFPAMQNASLSMASYLEHFSESSIKGTITSVYGSNIPVFEYSENNLLDYNHTWREENFTLPRATQYGNYTIVFEVWNNDSTGFWALDYIRVAGVEAPPNITTTTLPATTVTVTDIIDKNVTGVTENSNITTPAVGNITIPLENVTGIVTHGNTTEVAPPVTGALNHMDELREISRSMWNAFYVFLALFCACLLVILVLTAKGYFREEDRPPAVATYNPRTSSYRLNRAYDNRGMETNAV